MGFIFFCLIKVTLKVHDTQSNVLTLFYYSISAKLRSRTSLLILRIAFRICIS